MSLPRGKALSSDLVPDDCFTREELMAIVLRDYSIIFKGPRLNVMK